MLQFSGNVYWRRNIFQDANGIIAVIINLEKIDKNKTWPIRTFKQYKCDETLYILSCYRTGPLHFKSKQLILMLILSCRNLCFLRKDHWPQALLPLLECIAIYINKVGERQPDQNQVRSALYFFDKSHSSEDIRNWKYWLTSQKHLRPKVTPDFHLAYGITGGLWGWY